MAVTYQLISRTVLTSTAFDIYASNIPTTYDDLEIRLVARSTGAVNFETLRIWTNNQSTTNYYFAWVCNPTSQTVRSTSNTGYSDIALNTSINAASSPSNLFTRATFYVANYKDTSTSKQWAGRVSVPNSSATSYNYLAKAADGTSSAWTDFGIRARDSGGNAAIFDVGTSLYIYGIKNT